MKDLTFFIETHCKSLEPKVYSFFLNTDMGAEEFHGLITASSDNEAMERYAQQAPTSAYILETVHWVSKPNVRFVDMPSPPLTTRQEIVDYLLSKTSKWDTHTVMMRVSSRTYAYAVLLPS